jgi:tetratricopeptide (TPR) repeat protein
MDRLFWHPLPAAILAVVCWLVAPSLEARAQSGVRDRVVLRLEGASAPAVVSGTVVDYDRDAISIRVRPTQAPRSYPASQVIEVQTPQTEPHALGLNEFAAGRIDAAEAALEDALQTETRDWVRQDVRAMLVRCALRRGDYAAAGGRFLSLIEAAPMTRHFGLIPLWWAAEPPAADHENAARGWLVHSSVVAQLLGASALLTTPQHGAAAELKLRELLGSGTDYHFHLLAQAQLWRLRLNAGDLSGQELARWQARIESLPDDFQGGPYYVLGQGRLRLREYDRAAAALLRLPIVHPADHFLAARASLGAADALRAAGQTEHATAVYREISERFGETPFAQEARDALAGAARTAE